ncbi:DUF4240 domain-containing protein [Kitasatospora aureofaciens]|uniref:DUF4240 domain-containing protein n=1 Tax=Kitasatospora aureofaciens TaxID=1894 RepID=UPI0037C4F3F3
MTWEGFWKLIELLEGHADQRRCAELSRVLAQRPVSEITGFGERLAEALYRLDQERFGLVPVVGLSTDDDPFPQSSDVFLYSRCAVVAAGRAVYEGKFFGDPTRFSPFTSTALDGEWLLYVAQQAYEQVTGEEWNRVTRYDFESYSNPDGWPARR